MCWRRHGPGSQRRSRRPGQRRSSWSIASSTVAASISTWRGRSWNSGVSVLGSERSAISVDLRDLDRPDRRQVAGDLRPRVALVGAREELAGARAEVEAGLVGAIERQRRAEDAEVRVILRQTVREALPALAGVAGAPDGSFAVGHAARVAGVERDDVERVAIVRMGGCGEAELGRQPVANLGPRAAGVVAPVHADVVLLVEAARVGRRGRELV